MKLIDRERVDGTQVTIGRRIHYENGKQRIGRRFAAEYRNEEGEQVCETLRTSNKAQARRLALEIQQRVENGTDRQPEPMAAVSLPKAKASPQPCFTTEQVESLLKTTDGEERLAFSMMAYAGLRIGEVEQMRWEDIRHRDGKPTMFHVRRGGSRGTTKDKDERFVPVHPRIADYIGESKTAGTVFTAIRARDLLMRLKVLCKTCGFEKPDSFKLHSFRHHFASLCANHHVAYRKALAWLGHSSSEMLDLYYHLHDDDSQQAMLALAGVNAASSDAANSQPNNPNTTALAVAPENRFEGSLRAVGQSRIEKLLQLEALQELLICMSNQTERGGFDPARLLKTCQALILSPNVRSDNEFKRLSDVLFRHGFLPSRDAI